MIDLNSTFAAKKSPAGDGAPLAAAPARQLPLRDILVLVAVAWVARLAFMLIFPPTVRSVDADSWQKIAQLLAEGSNPYRVTPLLNWPPLWMQLIFCISKVSTALALPFFRVLQVSLMLVETAVMILTARLIYEIKPTALARNLVLLGIALNPIAILLTCQHCNFDIIVDLWLLLFAGALLRYNRGENQADWLMACLFLGLAILTKTVPLLLIPLLAGGFRRMANSFRFMGAFLLLGPTTLGMSIIYVLAPADVSSKVLHYRSLAGYFGFSGLIYLANADYLEKASHFAFYFLVLAAQAFTAILLWRRRSLADRDTLLGLGLLLAAVPALGPGYGTQYIFWSIPFLLASYAFYGSKWRMTVIIFGLVSVLTYLFEYALFDEFGPFLDPLMRFMNHGAGLDPTLPLLKNLNTKRGHVLANLPIFLAYLLLLVVGVRLFIRNVLNPPNLPAENASANMAGNKPAANLPVA
jgi:hypothetical protein